MSRLALAAVLAVSSTASANQPDHAFDETERLEHWSWVPLVSAQLAFDSAVADQTSGIFGAQLRIRHGTARAANGYHGQDPLRLWSFGIGVESVAFETVEPQLLIGRHWLPAESHWWGGPFFLDLRLDVGVGYAFGGVIEQPFFTVKAGAGMMMSRENKHVYEGRHGPVSYSKLRLRQQLDFIVQTHVARDGEWRLGVGIELDLARILTDVLGGKVPYL
jgi:hypothetical protein